MFAALFGLATSLGLGARQMAAGLDHLFGVPATDTTRVLLIAGITAVALTSVVAGLDRGVKRLSQANLVLALLLLAFVLAVGPTVDLLTGFVASLGHYVAAIGPLSNSVGRDDLDFLHGWTTFFWAWWLAWAPFVGMFIARVSRGRTVRVLVGCMLVVPVLVSALWMNVFGATALSHYLDAGQTAAVEAVQVQQPELALFRMLEGAAARRRHVGRRHRPRDGLLRHLLRFRLPGHRTPSPAGGKLDAPVAQRVFWCAFEGIVAITLLLGGGLVALQTASLVTGFPIAPIALMLVAMCYSIWKGLRAARST